MQLKAVLAATLFALLAYSMIPDETTPSEPRVSGSYSSLVTKIARTGPDPYLEERPTRLGGSGTAVPEALTFGSLEEAGEYSE